MISEHHLNDLIALVRRRYPDWEAFDDPAFVADEIGYKRAAVAQAQELISQAELDRLLAEGASLTILERLEKLANSTNLLWRRVPSQGDTAVFSHPNLDAHAFCTQVRNLLYGDLDSAERLQIFADYLDRNDLPNKWPLPTYLLFLSQPDSEMFVKPRTATWFLRFVGASNSAVVSPPTADEYRAVLAASDALLSACEPLGARDMVDVQSFVWVAQQESANRTGRLNARAQIELDVPSSRPSADLYDPIAPPAPAVAEPTPDYVTHPVRSLGDLAKKTGYAQSDLTRWISAVVEKRQAIFYGPPGTGKTFLAQELARYLVGGGNGLLELVQFHPAYAYEDFMQGLRPREDGTFAMQPGRFLDFCERARGRHGTSVFIIDEINRANLASVLGELMYLLEYRDASIPLAGGGNFSIPANVLILGTMNTADRSIALVDHALRRRFAFIALQPNLALLRRFHADSDFDVEPLIELLTRLNAMIDDPHFALGHSAFLRDDLAERLPAIWQFEVEPYLEELFFDQLGRVEPFRWSAVQDHLLSNS